MNKGLSLIEIMLSLAIFGILIVFASKMLNVSEIVSDNNNNDVIMTEVAQSIGEVVRISQAALVVGGTGDPINYPFPTGSAIYYYTVTEKIGPTDTLSKASISVSNTVEGLENESDTVGIDVIYPIP